MNSRFTNRSEQTISAPENMYERGTPFINFLLYLPMRWVLFFLKAILDLLNGFFRCYDNKQTSIILTQTLLHPLPVSDSRLYLLEYSGELVMGNSIYIAENINVRTPEYFDV